MIVDFHSHFLPGIDDGAVDEGSSLEMLRASINMGVTDFVSTSHCYPYSSEDIEEFLEKRSAAFEKLKAAAAEREFELPRIFLGSEVHLTCDISEMRAIKKLCIEGTDYMLLEMPSSPWNDSVVEGVYKLSIKGIKPIIAHMERNFGQKQELLDQLCCLDILVQVNAEAFAVGPFKKRLDTLVKTGMLHVIGTDMHNMDRRKPTMDIGKKLITKRYGAECWDYFMSNAQSVLYENNLPYNAIKCYKKKSLFG